MAQAAAKKSNVEFSQKTIKEETANLNQILHISSMLNVARILERDL